jgi:hypothetical protein
MKIYGILLVSNIGLAILSCCEAGQSPSALMSRATLTWTTNAVSVGDAVGVVVSNRPQGLLDLWVPGFHPATPKEETAFANGGLLQVVTYRLRACEPGTCTISNLYLHVVETRGGTNRWVWTTLEIPEHVIEVREFDVSHLLKLPQHDRTIPASIAGIHLGMSMQQCRTLASVTPSGKECLVGWYPQSWNMPTLAEPYCDLDRDSWQPAIIQNGNRLLVGCFFRNQLVILGEQSKFISPQPVANIFDQLSPLKQVAKTYSVIRPKFQLSPFGFSDGTITKSVRPDRTICLFEAEGFFHVEILNTPDDPSLATSTIRYVFAKDALHVVRPSILRDTPVAEQSSFQPP